MTAVQEPPLTTEEWPAQHERLVEQLRAVRPGLAQEQAHAVLQGLRTLGWAVHPTGQLCPPSTDAPRCCECGSMAVVYRNYQDRASCRPCADGRQDARCGATATGAYGATLTCSLRPHTGQPWHDNGRTQWQCVGTNGLWLKTR